MIRQKGLLRYTIPPNDSTVVLLGFFSFFTMGKTVICLMYIVWDKFPRYQGYVKRLDFIYYNNIILYIFDNTHVLLIPPMNTTRTMLKKLVVQN
jgi:hypothetical protein